MHLLELDCVHKVNDSQSTLREEQLRTIEEVDSLSSIDADRKYESIAPFSDPNVSYILLGREENEEELPSLNKIAEEMQPEVEILVKNFDSFLGETFNPGDLGDFNSVETSAIAPKDPYSGENYSLEVTIGELLEADGSVHSKATMTDKEKGKMEKRVAKMKEKLEGEWNTANVFNKIAPI